MEWWTAKTGRGIYYESNKDIKYASLQKVKNPSPKKDFFCAFIPLHCTLFKRGGEIHEESRF